MGTLSTADVIIQDGISNFQSRTVVELSELCGPLQHFLQHAKILLGLKLCSFLHLRPGARRLRPSTRYPFKVKWQEV